ncbi:MAG: hypothetical protein ABII71_00785 [Candidatus Micrarchaeota archaeon]
MAAQKKPKEKKQGDAPLDLKCSVKKGTRTVDIPFDIICPTFHFVRGNFIRLFERMFRLGVMIYLVPLAIFILLMIPPAVAILAAGYKLLDLGNISNTLNSIGNDYTLLFGLAVWLFLSIFICAWISKTLSLVAMLIVDERFKKKRTSTRELCCSIKFPVLKIILASAAIWIVALIIPAVVMLASMNAESHIMALGILFSIFFTGAAVLIYTFLTQFWCWEVVVGKAGVIEGLGSSYALARKCPVSVLLFDIVMIVASVVIAMPFIGLMFVTDMFLRFGSIITAFAGAGSANAVGVIASMIIFGVVSVLVRAVIQLLMTAALNSTVLVYGYTYWKELKKI